MSNYIDTQYLTNQSNEYDYFLAFAIASTLNDDELIDEVSSRYMIFESDTKVLLKGYIKN